RKSRWKQEMNAYVGQQIRTRLLDMIPREIDVTDAERVQLANSEVYKELTGVFWEAVGRNEALKSHKEHFYSNGIIYSTSIDVFLICGFAGFCYALGAVVLSDASQAYAAAALILISVVSRAFAIPRARQYHMTWIRCENAVSGLKGLQSGGPGEYRFCEAFYHR
ncbi:MAG TPA: hypothetical protein VII95_08470, partial [Terriglobales bacterium]